MMTGEDLTGIDLARLFFHEAVEPVAARVAPELRYTAGRFGSRSDALGLDDEISRDHGWGPGCTLLLEPESFEEIKPKLNEALRNDLPLTFCGYSTNYKDGNMVSIDRPPVNHAVDIYTPEQYLADTIGDVSVGDLGVMDWLSVSEQKLLEVTGGELFRDALHFTNIREQLSFYPDDLRLYLISVEWSRIADEQAFPGRAGSRGDEVGSAIIQARLAEHVMRICFYLERRYPPYSKWFGTAFQKLECTSEIYPLIRRMLIMSEWQERDRLWDELLRQLISLHERAGILPQGKYAPAPVYLGRPGTGLPAFERGGPPPMPELIGDIRSQIVDPKVSSLPERMGSINQHAACRDIEDEWPQWPIRP